MPCANCSDLDISNFDFNPTYFRVEGDDEVDETLQRRRTEEASANGCCFCKLLNSSLLKLGDWESATLYVRRDRPVVVRLWRLRDGTTKQDGPSLELYRPIGQSLLKDGGADDPWRGFPIAKEIASDLQSEVCLEFARNCLRSCLNEHQTCRRSKASGFPKRLIYIGPAGKPNDIRLVESPPASESYVALSHCWGGEAIPKSTTSALGLRLRSIEWNSLPKTYQDAIFFAKKFNVSYVWIDSLCIIQDSRVDWEVESAKMGDIYRNAYFTIAATSSGGPRTSFLSRSIDFPTYDFRFPTRSGGEVVIRARSLGGRNADHSVHCLNPDEPLNRRAWTYQERQLSTRVLHFTRRDVKWECRTVACSEAYAYSEPSLTFGSTSFMRSFAYVDHYVQWQFAIITYSVRNLTFPSDKLPAISGVASEVHRLSGSEYLAGVWVKNILDDLCWTTDWMESVKPEPSLAYRCPSFSWASIDGPIHYDLLRFYAGHSTKREYYARILDGKCKLAGANPFGEVYDGYITLSGPVTSLFQLVCEHKKASSPSAPDSWRHFLEPSPTQSGHIKADGERIHVDVDTSLGISVKSRPGSSNVTRLRQSGKREAFSSRVWLLTLFTEDGTPTGLVLTPSSRVSGSYERVGVFKASEYNIRPLRRQEAAGANWFDEVCQEATVTIV